MAKEPNRVLRVIVPLVLFVACGGIIFFSVMRNSASKTGPATTPAPVADAPKVDATKPVATGAAAHPPTPTTPIPTTPAPTTPPAAAATTIPAPANPSMGAAPAAPTQALASGTAYSAKTYPFTAYDPIGSITPKDKGGTFEMEVRFTRAGSGFERLALANHFDDLKRTTPEIVQSFHHELGNKNPQDGHAAMAASSVEVQGRPVDLWLAPDPGTTYWKQVSPGSFEAVIVDATGADVARITRTFVLRPGVFELELRQSIENVTGAPLSVRWLQLGPVSPPVGAMRYGGDVRRVRFGYMLPPAKDPERLIQADDRAASMITQPTAVGKRDPKTGQWQAMPLWPNDDSKKSDLTLVWAGMTNRFFTVAMFQLPVAGAPPGANRAFVLAEKIDRRVITVADPQTSKVPDDIALFLTTPTLRIEPGKSADVSLGVYAGPTSKSIAAAQAPQSDAAGIAKVVIYTFGGPCSFCTFQMLAGTLHDVLEFLQRHVVFDWALSIMLLVVCLRTILHPVTRWSQRRMYFVSKEMAKIAPKMKQIQEKYKDDPTKLREEQGRMMAEHTGTYAGMALGCIPAFLQTPVWIGLSAMIGFAFELHHQPAFFGVFQRISPSWTFLADLSAPDRIIPLPEFNIPLLSSFLGPIDGINVMPVVLGVVFFIQQKYLQPPQATPMTPEQEQQAKIMKVMTVVMFPLMMYNAPAGLALYFTTNSTLGILESKWIRKKAEEEYKEREAVKAAKIATRASGVSTSMWDRKEKVAKPQGFMAKLRAMAEEAQKQRELAAKRKKK